MEKGILKAARVMTGISVKMTKLWSAFVTVFRTDLVLVTKLRKMNNCLSPEKVTSHY